MRIYTRGGDTGETSLFSGERIAKSDPRVNAYGNVDELNTALGVVCAALGDDPASPALAALRGELCDVQRALFGVGAEIATVTEEARGKLRGLVEQGHVVALEASIDRMEEDLPQLTSFILPGGGRAGAALHVARTVCRRAERGAVDLARIAPVSGEVLRYLNRLADWLFVAARWVNHQEERPEVPW